MKLRVTHRTSYLYGDAVTTSHHEARLTPRDGESQRTLSHDIEITPAPESRRRRFDYFGNRVVHFSLSEPHRSLQVLARSVVEVKAPPLPPIEHGPSWESVRDLLARDRRRDLLDAYSMVFDSPLVPALPEVRAYAAPFFAPGRPILDAVRALMERIHTDFAYDDRATDLSTALSDVLRLRHGVCQDFAHVALACLRSHGLPARYVSGYLLTHPPPGKPKLVGADASHAWFSTFVPEYGWVDFDPTNDVMPDCDHVTAAYGRDFSDVTPLRGVILGGGQHQLTVAVDVDMVPDGEAPEAETSLERTEERTSVIS